MVEVSVSPAQRLIIYKNVRYAKWCARQCAHAPNHHQPEKFTFIILSNPPTRYFHALFALNHMPSVDRSTTNAVERHLKRFKLLNAHNDVASMIQIYIFLSEPFKWIFLGWCTDFFSPLCARVRVQCVCVFFFVLVLWLKISICLPCIFLGCGWRRRRQYYTM